MVLASGVVLPWSRMSLCTAAHGSLSEVARLRLSAPWLYRVLARVQTVRMSARGVSEREEPLLRGVTNLSQQINSNGTKRMTRRNTRDEAMKIFLTISTSSSRGDAPASPTNFIHKGSYLYSRNAVLCPIRACLENFASQLSCCGC